MVRYQLDFVRSTDHSTLRRALAVSGVGILATLLTSCGQIAVGMKLNGLNQEFVDRLQLATQELPAVAVGEPYSAQLKAEKGTPPYRWKIVDGGLPDGLALNDTSGEITGVPTRTVDLFPVVLLTDASGDPESYVLATIRFRESEPVKP